MRGLYATRDFEVGECVASYHGTTIDRKELTALSDTDPARFALINEYGVLTPDGHRHLYPRDVDKMGAHLINHSCKPNCRWDGYEHGAMFVRTLLPIAEGRELTIAYQWLGIRAAQEGKRHPCECDAPLCLGTIELMVEIIRWDHQGQTVEGPYLSVEHIAERFLADMVNDTVCHEATVTGYLTNVLALSKVHGKPIEKPDSVAFYQKLREGADVAYRMAEKRQQEGGEISEKRMRHFANRYHLDIRASFNSES